VTSSRLIAGSTSVPVLVWPEVVAHSVISQQLESVRRDYEAPNGGAHPLAGGRRAFALSPPGGSQLAYETGALVVADDASPNPAMRRRSLS